MRALCVHVYVRCDCQCRHVKKRLAYLCACVRSSIDARVCAFVYAFAMWSVYVLAMNRKHPGAISMCGTCARARLASKVAFVYWCARVCIRLGIRDERQYNIHECVLCSNICDAQIKSVSEFVRLTGSSTCIFYVLHRSELMLYYVNRTNI